MLAVGYYFWGLRLGEEKKFSHSIAYLKKAVEYNPMSPEAWYNLGGAFYTVGKYKLAKEAWLKTLKLNPKHNLAQQGLGAIPASGN